MDYHNYIQPDVQKMNRAPNFGGNIFPRVGSRDKNEHEIKAACPQPDQNRLKARMKRDKNIRETELYELVKQKRHSMKKRKNERLERNPAVEVEALEAQEIFFYSRQARNRTDEN